MISVGRLPNKTVSDDLRAFLSQTSGTIDEIRNKWGHIPPNDRFKDVALVKFTDAAGASAALALDGCQVGSITFSHSLFNHFITSPCSIVAR
jgi:hypothetical protein